MKIMSHRGFWKQPAEKNTLAALAYSVAHGFGTETDVRDRLGELVLAHDPALSNAPAWQEVVALFKGAGLPLAVNVKADGLSPALAKAFESSGIDWFAFDMSGPETVRFARAGLPYFTRHSDVEPEPILYNRAAGVWLDGFDDIWFDRDTITAHLAAGKRVCIVSPDLHGRDPQALWPMLNDLPDTVMLCTDIPDKALQYFTPDVHP
jgi:hypothetical protein